MNVCLPILFKSNDQDETLVVTLDNRESLLVQIKTKAGTVTICYFVTTGAIPVITKNNVAPNCIANLYKKSSKEFYYSNTIQVSRTKVTCASGRLLTTASLNSFKFRSYGIVAPSCS